MHSETLTGVELAPAMEEAIRLAADSIGERHVAVIAEFPAHLPAVRAEAHALPAYLQSLVELACAWVLQGEVKVRASLAQSQANLPTSSALIEVSVPTASLRPELEEGPAERVLKALPPEWLSGFERAQHTAASWQGSLAVGWTSPGSGELRLTLPLWAARGELMADTHPLRQAVETRLPASGGGVKRLMLMVEDEELRESLCADLRLAGYDLLVPEQGSQVVHMARAEKPDLVMLDVLLRDPPSFDVAMLLKQDAATRGIPVLFLTSGADAADRPRMGAVGFVVRPSGTGAILATVQSVLTAGLQPSSRVMVVEPDKNLRESMILVIQGQGFRVTEAAAAEEALVLAERVDPAVVLVNAQIAQERDYWLLRQLRQLTPHMQIMVVADAMSEAEGQAAMRRGASGFGETGKLPDLLDRVKTRHSPF